MISESMQDYLKTIYELRQRSGRATTNALAEKLGVAAASVTGMIKKLAEMKLVAYEPYQGATLTQAGEKMALAIVRHHRLIELYLTEAMGYTWDKVHKEADRLEHAISDEFADKISSLLGDPKIDPHGDPIPSKDGTVAAFSVDTLDLVPVGQTVRVERVRDEDPLVLRLVAQLGLMPGTVILVGRQGTEMIVEFEGGLQKSVGQGLAQNIFVTAR
jgi:DtxR family transcriptional regulator, Mn-dependent transcriptional regulator